MACKNCPPSTAWLEDIRFKSVKNDLQVKPGDTYNIYVIVEQVGTFAADYGRLCLYDRGAKLAQSGSFKLNKNEVYQHQFTGIMPDRDLYLNVSLVDEQIYGVTNCADGKAIHIKKGAHTIIIDPVLDPVLDPKDNDAKDLFKNPFQWITDNVNDAKGPFQWIMDNIVMVLILLLVIIIIIKFG